MFKLSVKISSLVVYVRDFQANGRHEKKGSTKT